MTEKETAPAERSARVEPALDYEEEAMAKGVEEGSGDSRRSKRGLITV
jgi:hypothetical protein